MSHDSETVEHTQKGSLAEVTDDSCTVEYIEIAPLDRASDDYHKLEFIDPVVEVKPEDLLDVKQEPDDESNVEEPNYSLKPEQTDENDDVSDSGEDENDGDHNYSVKQEPSDEYKTEADYCTVHVSSACLYRT